MGEDFLRGMAPKFQKQWDQGRLDLQTPDLFLRQPTANVQTCSVTFASGADMKAGDQLSVHSVDGKLIAAKGTRKIGDLGRVDKVTALAVKKSGGVALGVVTKVSPLSGTGEISLS